MPPPHELPARTHAADDCRCVCGSLLARLVGDGVELFCRRCKRTHWIAFHPRPEAESPESRPRAQARTKRIRWLDPCDEVS